MAGRVFEFLKRVFYSIPPQTPTLKEVPRESALALLPHWFIALKRTNVGSGPSSSPLPGPETELLTAVAYLLLVLLLLTICI